MNLFLVLLLLTGCVKNVDFEKECSVSIKSNNMMETVNMNIFYDNNDVIKNVIYTRNFKVTDGSLDEIKQASNSYNRRYDGKNIEITVSKDTQEEFEMKYYFDARKVSSEILKEFNLKKNSIKLFRSLKKKGIECEVKNGNN